MSIPMQKMLDAFAKKYDDKEVESSREPGASAPATLGTVCHMGYS